MANFMGQHSAYFIATEALQQPGTDCHKSVISIPASGKSIGLLSRENTHFRHAYIGFFSQFCHSLHQPALLFGLWLLNNLCAARAFGHKF